MVDLKALHRHCLASLATAAQMVRDSNAARKRIQVGMDASKHRVELATRAMDRASAYLAAARQPQREA